MTWSIVTRPGDEPISLDEAKLHLRVDGSDDDSLITGFIATAREHVEAVCERALMPQVWAERSDSFAAQIELRGGVVTSIEAISYIDTDGVTRQIDPATCVSDLTVEPALLLPPFGQSWPVARKQPGSIVVRYGVGYDTADTIPSPLKSAMLLMLGDLYEHRTGKQDVQLFENSAVKALLWPYRRVRP